MDAMKSKIDSLKTLADAEALYPPRNLPAGTEVMRIAPSPTGMPHIGTAMQAVIDRAMADKTKGIFILRIEDTDKARSVPGAEQALIDALRWLGVPPDEAPFGIGGAYGPYTQSERLNLYQIAADHLVKTGHAYHCFCSAQRLEALREAATKAKMMPKYDRHCRSLSVEEVETRHKNGERSTIRMCVPEDGTKIDIRDEVRGDIVFDAKVLDDSVLMKSDGYPTYHLAAVVDDHFMRVTTVVRGEEWIASTPKHVLLYKAFGWAVPKFLHTVLLRDEQRRKLSKRSGDTSIAAFRLRGYLPEGFRNFLTRVIWAHPECKDIYDFPEFARLMVPTSLPSTGPVADFALLNFINGQYISKKTPSELRALFCAYLDYLRDVNEMPEILHAQERGIVLADLMNLKAEIEASPEHSERILALEPERHHALSDIFQNCGFLFASLYRGAPAELLLKYCPDVAKAQAILTDVIEVSVNATAHDSWEQAMRALAAKHEVPFKSVFMLARVGCTGLDKTPPLYDIIQILGPELVRQRLTEAMERVSAPVASAPAA